MPREQRLAVLATLSPKALREVRRQTESLYSYIPRVSPSLEAPRHLAPIVKLFESAERGPVQAVLSTPPQHAKTETAAHALAKFIGRNPHRRNGYATYEANRAQEIGEKVRAILLEDGIRTKGSRKRWTTAQKGGLITTGIAGPLTGRPIDGILIIDDPVKNRAEAESPVYREKHDQWFRSTAYTRLHPSASTFVILTRWHDDDLGGRLIKRGWPRVNLQAINDAGVALWEKARPAAWLEKVRVEVGEYTWWSLYQGEPRPRGGALFKNATLYKSKDGPDLSQGFEVSIGIDLAYSKKTHADWSVAVVMARAVRNDFSKKPVYYVLEVKREQCKAPVFKNIVREISGRYPFAKIRWYASGVEQGVGDLLSLSDGDTPGLALNVLPAVADKFVRAQPFAAAWNDSRILIPEDAPWASDFITEIVSFTGVNDPHDDQVDAGGSAYDELAPTSDLEFFNQMSTVN